ncbi:sugar phosphate nucleotidyltransferase [Arthrobacter sp. Br18]|uniref:glucose-1-phosphate adenylyltransferase family protein n=1 Tax=Arthrobacter sp. Br18 TaxID=1312954 RepID=UPI0004B5A09F|nr:sugar phosphate nucleotidyltransferase [Arthrobacter sp. Br18]
MKPPRVLALVMAGGSGNRMGALTEHRAKPALPFGGAYRLIDVPLSNLHHSGIFDVWILEQYQPKTINDHLSNGRPWDLDRTHGGLRVLPPFSGTSGEGFAEGNADGLMRQSGLIDQFKPDLLLVLSADHLYHLDYRDLMLTHQEAGAALTMATALMDGDASNHGVIEADRQGRITGFEYKPEKPRTQLAAAEVFLYDWPQLRDTLELLESRHGSLKDYGDYLVPHLVREAVVVEHRIEGYWRDLGTPETYHQAHMDLLDGKAIDLGHAEWPMLTDAPHLLPAFIGEGAEIVNSLVAPGARVHGRVIHSVIGPGTVVEQGAVVEDSVILERVTVGPGMQVRYAIVDAGAELEGEQSIRGSGRPAVVGSDGQLDQ